MHACTVQTTHLLVTTESKCTSVEARCIALFEDGRSENFTLHVNGMLPPEEPYVIGDTKTKLGPSVARLLRSYIGPSYSVVRRIEPDMASAMDALRTQKSFWDACLLLCNRVPPALFDLPCAVLVLALRTRYAFWTGNKSFFPHGARYSAWLEARLILERLGRRRNDLPYNVNLLTLQIRIRTKINSLHT
jgi:hypothetical protein